MMLVRVLLLVVALSEDKRMYHLLEHVGARPNVFYQVKVRNNN